MVPDSSGEFQGMNYETYYRASSRKSQLVTDSSKPDVLGNA
jgi:hypothetical protein